MLVFLRLKFERLFIYDNMKVTTLLILMTNLNPKASLFAIYYVFAAIVFTICHLSLNLPFAASILIAYTLIAVPTYKLLKMLFDAFPLRKNLWGYAVCLSAIAVAILIVMGGL